jgi:hypothetical protein
MAFPEDKFSAHHKKAACLEAAVGRVETLILGTSHANEGILPGLIGPGAFNLAHPSQTPDYDAALLSRVVESGAPLKLVLVAVSPFSPSHKPVAHSPAKWTTYRYKSAYGLAMPDWRLNVEFRAWHAFFREDRLFGLKDWAVLGGKKGSEMDAQGGFSGFEDSIASQDAATQARLAKERALAQQAGSSGPEAFTAAESWGGLARMALARGAKVVFFSMPHTPEYIAEMRPWIDAAAGNVAGLSANEGCLWHDWSTLANLTPADFHVQII